MEVGVADGGETLLRGWNWQSVLSSSKSRVDRMSCVERLQDRDTSWNSTGRLRVVYVPSRWNLAEARCYVLGSIGKCSVG